ncbi:MAG: TrkA family potassium uptake protein, partial [Solirubrobacteraceae bacterium]|nr:TrkA family potassium uptake protein [Solirubrobacteraceae bacterium]
TAARLAEADSVVVLGLGRFGSAIARELVKTGTEVLGIDRDEDIVQEHSTFLTHVVTADTTNVDALRQIAVPEFDRAVVGIGTNIEASLLTASVLVEFEIPTIWAKAISEPHGRILEQLGVHHVVAPERDMGKRVAHLVRGAMLDYIEFEDNFAMVKTRAPSFAYGLRLSEAKIRAEYGVTVIAIHKDDSGWTYATAETVLEKDDKIIVSGPTRKTEKFALLH